MVRNIDDHDLEEYNWHLTLKENNQLVTLRNYVLRFHELLSLQDQNIEKWVVKNVVVQVLQEKYVQIGRRLHGLLSF